MHIDLRVEPIISSTQIYINQKRFCENKRGGAEGKRGGTEGKKGRDIEIFWTAILHKISELNAKVQKVYTMHILDSDFVW